MKNITDQIELNRQGKGLGIPKHEILTLYDFIKANNIKRVIETGVCHGVSSAYILAALPADGLLISIEPDTGLTIGEVIPDELRNKWRLIPGKSQDVLLDVFNTNPCIDLFLHDSDHHATTQQFEFGTALPFVKYIASHDISLFDSGIAWKGLKIIPGVKLIIENGQLGICDVRGAK